MFVPQIFSSEGSVNTGDIGKSLRFRGAQYIAKTLAAPTARNLFCISMHVKRAQLGVLQTLLWAGGDATNKTVLRFDASDRIQFYSYNGSARGELVSTSYYRDPTAFFHLFALFDFDAAASGDRVKIWINGVQIAFTVTTAVASGAVHYFNIANAHRIGSDFSAGYYQGYLARIAYVDGTARAAADFGYFNTAINEWITKSQTEVKQIVDAGGVNSFMLDFENGTSLTTLGEDFSTKGNDWTLTGHSLTLGADYDWMLDVPGNSYATLNPLTPATAAMSDGNLKYLNAAGSSNQAGITIFPRTGVSFYVEGTAVSQPAANDFSYIGDSNCYYASSGKIYVNGSLATTVAGFVNNDVVAIAGTVGGAAKVYKNGSLVYDATTAMCGGSIIVNTYSGGIWNMNFGQRPFAYTLPAGFKHLSQRNLTEPATLNPETYFRIVSDTGANIKSATEAVFGGNLLEVIKDRANTNNWQWLDSVRGLTAVLQSNTTALETVYATPAGISVGFAFKAGGAAVANNAGSISSQVSATASAGFSVVSYTGTGANATVGHGLSRAPELIIAKNRATVGNWSVYDKDLTSPAYALKLNLTDAQASLPTIWNSLAPDATKFNLGTSALVNEATKAQIAYCFHSVEGFSKVGTYTGNGSADGPYIDCGFKPAFILCKRVDAVGSWWITDAVRNPANVANLNLYVESSAAESSLACPFDLLSAGFKARSATYNVSAAKYIFLAIAEVPAKYSFAR